MSDDSRDKFWTLVARCQQNLEDRALVMKDAQEFEKTPIAY
jgi:hypothetical protein